MRSEELSATFDARGVNAAAVIEDARRIAAQVFPELETWLSYGALRPGLVSVDRKGSHVDHWTAEVTARATVPDVA